MVSEDESFTFETIATVYREERKSKTLTVLPMHFYEKLSKYINELKTNYVEEKSKDPISSKTMMLEDEYIKAQKRASQIYEHRERKMVLLALAKSNSGDPDVKSLTRAEQGAFSEIVDILSENKNNIMLQNEQKTCETKTFLKSDQTSTTKREEVNLDEVALENNEEQIKVNENEKNELENEMQDNPVLLILEDVPSFETEKRSYNLKKDDAISLSKDVAKILCKHKKARIIKGNEQIL
jgi:DNA replication initiation complex subunit (GINS family)